MPVELKGFDRWKGQLANLSKQGAKRAIKKAVRAGTTVMARAVRRETPVDKGLLKRAETSKISNGKRYGIAGIVGADQDKLNTEAAGGKRPSNIDHLVDEGHVMPDGRVVPGQGYMARAEQEAGQAAMDASIAKLATEIASEASKVS